MTEKYFIGVDLGGTNIKAGIVADDTRVIVKTSIPTEAEHGADHVMLRIAHTVESVLELSGIAKEHIGGIGVGCPGTLDIKAGMVRFSPNLLGWRDVPVVEHIKRLTGLPVVLENDANAAAYGEFWAGAARDARSMVMFTLGTGIGGGIVTEGILIHGDTDCAAELGHMIIEANGRKCACGNWGCLEAYASANSLARRFAEAVNAGEQSSLSGRILAGEAVNSRAIYEAAIAGDPLANRVFRETGVYLGMGIVNILHTVNPARVLLSGGMIAAGELLMRPVRETVDRRALHDARRKCDIVFATLGEDAGFIGGAGCALVAFGTSR